MYSRIVRTDGGMRPIIKTLGATSPGMSISFIIAMTPKNDASSVAVKKKTMPTSKIAILAGLLVELFTTSDIEL